MTSREIQPVVKRLSQSMIDRYADASGDHNPIHIDEAFARTSPMGGIIAHGMLVLAFISEMMTAAFGRQWLESGKLEVRFRAPARPGDMITARPKPAGKDGDALRYNVVCVSGSGDVLISGTAQVQAS